MNNTRIEVRTQTSVILAREKGRELARQLGFGTADQTRLCTAISELTRNVIQYAGEGDCIISDRSDKEALRVLVIIEDHGPGITDIDKAMEYGFSTGNGLGVGLPGAKKLVTKFSIKSKPGQTKITIEMVK